MAAAIKELPDMGIQSFRHECQLAFDHRWQQFDFKIYLLAYFLHPQYQGIIYKFIFNILMEIIK